MHLIYKPLSHSKEKAVYTDHDVECTILKPDDFKQYKQEWEENNRYVHVVAKTRFKELDESEETKDSEDYLEVPDEKGEFKKFKIYKKRHRLKTIGYLPISDTEFVQIEAGLLLLLLFIPILIILSIGLYFGTRPNAPDGSAQAIEDDNTHDWDGEGHRNGKNSTAASENTTIPGFAMVTADKVANNVELYNPKENTVKFVYTVTEQTAQKTVGTFNTINEAQTYVTEHEYVYKNDYDTEGKYQLIDTKTNKATDTHIEYSIKESGKHKFKVLETTSKVIYFTKGIAPGKAVNWNIYESLTPGEHELKFRISTYDVKTEAQCYGAVLDVQATIQ